MPPTPECTMRASTSSVPSLRSAPPMASTEPCTSPLTTQRELLAARLLELLHHLLERARRAGRAERLAALAHAVVGDLARAAVALDHGERIARLGRGVEAQDLDRHRRPGLGDRLAAYRRSGRARAPTPRRRRRCRRRCSVPRWTSTVPTGPRPRSSLASMTTPSAERSGLAFRSSSSACRLDGLQQLVEAGPLQGRHLDLERLARHALDDDLVLQQLRAHAVGIGAAACRSC